jgi:hypothetical protein
MSYPSGDEVRVLHRADPLAPQRAGQALPDRAVWTSVPLVTPDAWRLIHKHYGGSSYVSLEVSPSEVGSQLFHNP